MTILRGAEVGTDAARVDELDAYDEALKALANPVRRQILGWLKEPQAHFANQEHPMSLGVCAGQITAYAGLSQSTMSAHLAILLRANLVSARRVGQWVFFKRDDDAIKTLLGRLHSEL
jgi:DNA-binding transcriptional ArsR family regulator